jgi:hypothetical protein
VLQGSEKGKAKVANAASVDGLLRLSHLSSSSEYVFDASQPSYGHTMREFVEGSPHSFDVCLLECAQVCATGSLVYNFIFGR